MCVSLQGILLSNKLESKHKMTTLIAFDSVEYVIFVSWNWYLRKPDDRPVYKTYFSELLVFVKCMHTQGTLLYPIIPCQNLRLYYTQPYVGRLRYVIV